jgi:hypothetical protein
MIAKSNTNEFKFKQTCGIVKFAIKGSQIIEWLTLTGNNNEIISGTGCVNLNDLSYDEIVARELDLTKKDTYSFLIGCIINSVGEHFINTIFY